MAIVIPDWVARAPKPTDSTGQASSASANDAADGSEPKDLQIQTNGREQIIPIVYGGPERMAGLLYCVATPKAGSLAGRLVFACVLCEGPVESVDTFELSNGDALPAYIAIHSYKGDAGNVLDPWLAAAIPGFAETLPGIAYFVANVSSSEAGFPAITALVRGLLVDDERAMFWQIHSSINAGWANSTPPPVYTVNAGPARDGTQTAHSLANIAPALPVRRYWTLAVPNDNVKRSTSISINKDAASLYLVGVGLEYLGGATPRSHVVQIDLASGAVSTFSGSGGTFQVIEHPNHYELVFSMANNATGNNQFRLSLYPNT
jgi:hypothetical protein